MAGFISTYFLNAFVVNGLFNPVNTAVLAIALVVAALGVYKLLSRLKIRIDFRFFLAILPFIFWASATRSLRDYIYMQAYAQSGPQFLTDLSYNFSQVFAVTQQHILTATSLPQLADFYALVVTFFPTPGSYFITFFAALISLLIALGVQKLTKAKIQYWKVMFALGFILSALTMWFLPLANPLPFVAIAGTTLLWVALIYSVSRLLKLSYFSKWPKAQGQALAILSPVNQAVLAAHFLDASSTFFALTNFGYFEQHVLPTFLINIFGPIVMFPLKIVVVLIVLALIDRYSGAKPVQGTLESFAKPAATMENNHESQGQAAHGAQDQGTDGMAMQRNRDFSNFLKIVIVILGLAPGLRDLIRLVAGV